MIFGIGIFGFIISYFADDPELAATVRSRCLIGMAIGVVMVIAWKIYSSRE
jgi:F0F1-type ATP synthase membrane subunit c/vacuolar-type H+-ATPase subunit K